MHSVSTLFVAALLAPVEALVLTTGARPSPTAMARSRNILLEEPPPPPSGGRLGGTIDQDGKSNVWAVEPSMKVDKADKGLLVFAPVVGVAALAFLSIPLLPALFAANPDQA